MAVHLWRHSAGLLETIKCVYLSLRKLHAVWLSVRSVPAFTAPKSTGHESFLSTWQRPRTWLKTTKYRARGITVTSWGMQGHCPFPSSPSPPLFSSHLSLGSPMSLGCRLRKVSRCDWNTEPHSEEKATGQRGAKDLHQVHIFTVCRDLQPCWT